MYCARCGSENPDDGKFCRKCGERIGLIDPATSEERPGSDDSSASSARRERYATGARRFIWGVLLLVLGVFAGIPLKGTGYSDLTLLPGALLVVWSMATFVGLSFGSRPEPEKDNEDGPALDAAETQALPPESTVFAKDEIPETYETGDLVPTSVTEVTTRNLEIGPAGEVSESESEN